MMKKRILLIAVLLMMFLLTGCGKQTVNLNKYMTISSSGYDSVGKAEDYFDREAFKKDFSGKIKVNKNNKDIDKELAELFDEAADELFLDYCVDYNLDKFYSLSNGEVITLKWDCDKTLALDAFNVNLVYSDITYEVSNLKKLMKTDPFNFIDILFVGASGEGKLKYRILENQDAIMDLTIAVEGNGTYVNGDNVTVHISTKYGDDSFAAKFGWIPSLTEKDYLCDSLAEYYKNADEISYSKQKDLITKGEDIFREYVNTKWDKPENLISVSYEGNYLLSLNEGEYGSNNNYLYLVYKAQAINTKPVQTVDFYYYVCFEDIGVYPDGSLYGDLENYTVPKSSLTSSEYFKVGAYVYTGFKTVNDMYEKSIVYNTNNGRYTVTSSFDK